MKHVALLLVIPALSSCGLLQVPGRLLQSAGRTIGLGQNDVELPGGPDLNPTANVALQTYLLRDGK